jgi:hypothetical protein
VRSDIVHSLSEESLLVFSELSDKWHVFLSLYSRRPQTSVKHSRGPSDRAQLVVSLKRSQSSVVYSSISDLVSSQASAHRKGIGFLDIVAPALYSQEEVL